MKYYTNKEVQEILGWSQAKVTRYCQLEYLKDCIKDARGNWLTPQSAIDEQLELQRFKENSYSVPEIAEIFGMTTIYVRKEIIHKNFSNEIKRIDKEIYVPKVLVDELYKEKTSSSEYKGYYTNKEVQEILNWNEDKVRISCRKGYLKNCIQNELGHWYIPQSAIDDQLAIKEFILNSYSLFEIQEMFNVSKNHARRQLVLKYFSNDYRKIEGVIYVPKVLVEKLYLKEKEYIEYDNYYTFEEIGELLNLERESVVSLFHIDKFPVYSKSIFLTNPVKVKKSCVQQYISERDTENDGCYSLEEARELLNLESTISVKTLCKKGFLKYKVAIRYQETRVLKESLEEFKIIFDKQYSEDIADRLEHRFYMEKLPNKFNKTIQLYYEHLVSKLRNSNYKPEREITKISVELKTLNYLLSVLNRNINDLSDNQIMNILEMNDTKNYHRRNIVSFITYLQLQHSDKIKFKNNYSFNSKTALKRVDKDTYTWEEFLSMYNYCKRLELHTVKSINNPRYAQLWFFVSMHFINAWRASDIVDFPKVDISALNIGSVEWFLENQLDLSQSQFIVNQITDRWETLVISKTGALNKFLVNLDMVQIVATAIAINELHSKEKNKLLFLYQRSIPKKNHYDIFFENFDIEVSFSSLKANRSFMTHFFHSVQKRGENGDISHILTKRLRGHENQDTISEYVMTSNKDGDLDLVSHHLFRRGHFGWLYYSLVQLVLGDIEDDLNVEDKTKMVEHFQKIYSPKEIESMSSFLLNAQKKKSSIAMELALSTKDELESKLIRIYNGEMPSREEESQCFVSGNCINPTGSCYGCPYLIPKVYLLTSLRDEIVAIISKLEEMPEYKRAERMKNTFILFKLLDLLTQSVKMYGKKYIVSFIDLNQLQQKLLVLDEKLLIPERM